MIADLFDFQREISFFGDVVRVENYGAVDALIQELSAESDTFLIGSLRENGAVADTPNITMTIEAEQDDSQAPVAVGSIVNGELGLAVLAAFSGQGLGQIMMDMLLNWARLQKFSSVWLEVQTDNAPAIHIYDKFGFVNVGQSEELTLPNGRVTVLQRMELSL